MVRVVLQALAKALIPALAVTGCTGRVRAVRVSWARTPDIVVHHVAAESDEPEDIVAGVQSAREVGDLRADHEDTLREGLTKAAWDTVGRADMVAPDEIP